jgi:hypothetical protein
MRLTPEQRKKTSVSDHVTKLIRTEPIRLRRDAGMIFFC